MTTPPTVQTNPLDPVYSGVPVVYPQTGMLSPTWNKWFVDLREKVNVINATVAALSGGTLKPVIEVHPGVNVSVDNTDIQNPVVSASGGGGGGGTPPLAANFTTFGTGISIANATGRMRATVTPGTTLRGFMQSSLAPPYTIDLTLGFLSAAIPADSVWAGLVLSNGTKFRAFYAGAAASSAGQETYRFAIDSWANSTSFSTSPRNSSILLNPYNFYLRVTDSGTTRSFYMSSNGLDFVLVYSEPTNTYVTPTEFGVGSYNDSQNSYTANLSITNWVVTNSVLGNAP